MTETKSKSLARRAPEARRARVIEAADQLFRDQGYEDTSIAQVAKRAGVAAGTVYLFFPDKPSLRIGVINARKAEIAGLLAHLVPRPDDDLRTALSRVITPVLEHMLRTGPVGGPIDRTRLEDMGPEAVAAYGAVDDAIRDLFAMLEADGRARPTDPKTMPILSAGLMTSAVEGCRAGICSPEDMTTWLVDAFERLLRPG